MKGKKWTPEEDEILKSNYEGGAVGSWRAVQALLKEAGFIRPKRGIYSRAQKLGLCIGDGRSVGGSRPSGDKIGSIKLWQTSNKSKLLYIKTAAGWVHLARHILEEAGRPVPEGSCVWYIDGDRKNCQLSNLEIISQAEQRRRNNKGFCERQRILKSRPASVNLAEGFRPVKLGRWNIKYLGWK